MAHVRARVTPAEELIAARLLDGRALDQFNAMPVADRRHALDVVARLMNAGHDDRDLLAAALLHDAAKGDRMRLWHRVGGVLLATLGPSVLRWLADPDPSSWRHGFHLYLHHAPMSADLADRAGCPPRVGGFIRGSVPSTDAQLLRALEVADDAS